MPTTVELLLLLPLPPGPRCRSVGALDSSRASRLCVGPDLGGYDGLSEARLRSSESHGNLQSQPRTYTHSLIRASHKAKVS